MNMRERITLQTITLAADGAGGNIETLATLATVWARVQPVKGSEIPDAGRLQAKQTYLVIIRHRTDITTGLRVVWGAKMLNIRSVQNRDERKQYLTLECETP